eukprot:1344253-Amphidinium_carterae.1
MSCCKCGSDSNIVGCMFEGCDHYWCRDHCMRLDGNGDTEGSVTRRQFQRTVIMLLVQEVLTKVNAKFAQIQEECCVNTKDLLNYTGIVVTLSAGSMPKSLEIMMMWSRECGAISIQEKDPERMSYQPRGVDIAIPRGIYSSASGRCVDIMLVMIVT